jgi:predicted helicase
VPFQSIGSRGAFQEALVHDLDAEGFADMYAQTIAYGLLSARIADPKKKTADDFAAHMRTNPFLRELMETFLKVGGRRGKAGGPGIDFDELGVSEVVELLDAANMDAVVRDFGDKNRQEDPVIHFYELFLSAYNQRLRIRRGVFYTPQPVVSYIVRRVHELLQTEFGLADGLADTTTWGEMLKKHPNLKLPPLTDEPGEKRTISPDEPFVQILDPATGTATFLVEVIDVIHRTLATKWQQQHFTDAQRRAAWNDYVPRHLLPRLHAFELMMAPYAIAHMKIGLKLAETGYRFGTEERARIYLTNALEPWMRQLPLIGLVALAHEAAAVNEIKRNKRFTVVIGNPPYSSAAGSTQTGFLADIMRYFTTGLGVEDERKKGALQDEYIRFVALCRHIINRTTVGIIGMITNNSYLDGTLHRAMRRSLMEAFPRIDIANLHGSSRAGVGGATDENVFDIMQGVAVITAVQHCEALGKTPSVPQIRYADLLGTRVAKYAALTTSAVIFAELIPAPPHYLLRPLDRSHFEEYETLVSIQDVFGVFSSGIETEKDHFAVDFDAAALRKRLVEFCDLAVSAKDVSASFGLKNTPNWNLVDSRKALAKEGLKKDLFTRYLFHCFDWRYTYYSDHLVTRLRRPVMRHMSDDNLALITLRQVKGEPWAHAFVTVDISNKFTLSSKSSNVSYHFPLFLMEADSNSHTLVKGPPREINLRPRILRHLAATNGNYSGTCGDVYAHAREVFYYIYCVFHSPGYRSRYAEYLKIDFPRLPLAGSVKLFHALVRLGEELVALHLLESPKVNKPITEFIGGRRSEVEKISWSRGTVWLDNAQAVGFRGVPEPVWNFHIGGYQICEKWLKDRKGRTLSKDDISHYQKVVVALTETIGLMKEIDDVVEAHGGWPGAFQSTASGDTASKPSVEAAAQ